MQIDLLYGTVGLTLTLPDNVSPTIIRKPRMPRIEDPRFAVAEALKSPVGVGPLAELARSARNACIAVCDITRPVPNHLFLRPVIETLTASGIPADRITILVATGLHRPNEGPELEKLVGDPWVLENVRVVNHFARSDADHVSLGTTSTRGTVVRLDRRFVEADLRIATGLVEPHFMAGYSGGRKVIAPGLAHAETITTFHSARFMSDPLADSCNLAGNPLHEEQLEIVRMLGGALAINTVIDEQRELSFVNFGEIVASHQAAVDFIREYCEIPVPRRFCTVVTSAAGDPLDKTYYQTVKGMVCAMDILEPGGDLIIVSSCSEGMGSEEFVAAQQQLVQLGSDGFVNSIMSKTHAAIDEWQTQMQTKPMRVGNIHLVTNGLRESDHELTGVRVTSSLQDVVEESLGRNLDRAVAVIPEGPYTVPFFRPPS
jgi:lactate racemase